MATTWLSGPDSVSESSGGAGAVLSTSSRTETPPSFGPWGSTTTVCVPLWPSRKSIVPPSGLKPTAPPAVVPSGARIVRRRLQQLNGPVTSLTPSPAEAEKETRPFWPGTVVVTTTAGPPSVAVAVASGGTT